MYDECNHIYINSSLLYLPVVIYCIRSTLVYLPIHKVLLDLL